MKLKYILLVVYLLVGSLYLLDKLNKKRFKNNSYTPLVEPTTYVNPTSSPFTNVNGINKIEWLIIRDLNKISLYSNLEDQYTSTEIIEKYMCESLISGSFYSKENKHIGLFISNYKNISDVQKNALLNSYFYITENKAFISQLPPKNARLAIQTGPLLYKDGKPISINSNNNEERRVLVATTKEGHAVFLVIYNTNSQFKGPKLSELPDILTELQKNTSLDFVNAINMDGGTASSFITDYINISELSRIGSYFCVK